LFSARWTENHDFDSFFQNKAESFEERVSGGDETRPKSIFASANAPSVA